MYTLILMTMFMQTAVDSPPIIEYPWWEVQTECYPKEKVVFGDVVFLRYEHKNILNRPEDLDYGRYMLFEFALYQGEKFIGKYLKSGSFGFRGPGAHSMYHVLVQPGDTFTIYEAVLIPSPDRGYATFRMPNWPEEPEWHPFWDFSENSNNEYSIDANIYPWHQTRYHYFPNRRMPVTIVDRSPEETQFLKGWYDKHLDVKIIQNSSVFSAVDPILANTFKDATPDEMQELLDNVPIGTFHYLVRLNASLGLSGVENPEKPFIESYQSPDEEFWTWFDGLPELEHNFFAIAVVRAYCSKILSPTFPEWVTQGIPSTMGGSFSSTQVRVQISLENSENEYAARKEQYDRFIGDWMPKLPKENGEGMEMVRLLQRLMKE